MHFVKDHEEFYNNNNDHFKNKARKECLWERFTNSRKLSVKVYKTWFDLQRTHYVKVMQSKSGHAPKEIMERQNYIQDKFHFLKSYIRYKRLKSSGLKSQAQGASASAHNFSRASTNTDSMDISISQQTPHYSLNKSPAPP